MTGEAMPRQGFLVHDVTGASQTRICGIKSESPRQTSRSTARLAQDQNHQVPLVFDPDMAAGLSRSSHRRSVGPSLYKGASFPRRQLGTQIAASGVKIIDDPLILGGLGSKHSTGRGLQPAKKIVRTALSRPTCSIVPPRANSVWRRPATRREMPIAVVSTTNLSSRQELIRRKRSSSR